MKTVVFLANGFEEIEALATVDVLRRAGFSVRTASIHSELLVEGAHSINVLADTTFDEESFEDVDLLILPGGMPGTKHLGDHEGLKALLLEHAAKSKWIAAICAAPKVLGELGLLKGQFATCYPGFEVYLKGAIHVDENVVVSGHYVTGKGAGAAIEFALKLVELFADYETARELGRSMIAE